MKAPTAQEAQEQHARLEELHDMLKLSKERLLEIYEGFLGEIQKGLNMHKQHGKVWVPEECSLKMLDSCVKNLPTGKERGCSYALDFGGSTVRAVCCNMRGDGKLEVIQEKVCLRSKDYPCPKGLMDRKANGTDLFNEFAFCARRLMERVGYLDSAAKIPQGVGFTFSFPCSQTALDSATLIEWTKGFETGRDNEDRVEGRDVARLLDDAFKRCDCPATCKAVVNDTVGTLVSCCYQKQPNTPDCLVGLIIGTGTNCCYVEPEYASYGYVGKIVNVESGNYNKALPWTDIDIEVDEQSHNTGKQQFEKFISGYYIGDIVRVATKRVFKERSPPRTRVRHSMNGEIASRILADDSEMKEATREAVKECWEVSLDIVDATCLHQICKYVFERSAALAGVSIAALCRRTGALKQGVTVGIDGALYIKNAWYRDRVRHYVNLILEGDGRNVHLCMADDGSGKGAALIAAVC